MKPPEGPCRRQFSPGCHQPRLRELGFHQECELTDRRRSNPRGYSRLGNVGVRRSGQSQSPMRPSSTVHHSSERRHSTTRLRETAKTNRRELLFEGGSGLKPRGRHLLRSKGKPKNLVMWDSYVHTPAHVSEQRTLKNYAALGPTPADRHPHPICHNSPHLAHIAPKTPASRHPRRIPARHFRHRTRRQHARSRHRPAHPHPPHARHWEIWRDSGKSGKSRVRLGKTAESLKRGGLPKTGPGRVSPVPGVGVS